jgi:hypothetical protein
MKTGRSAYTDDPYWIDDTGEIRVELFVSGLAPTRARIERRTGKHYPESPWEVIGRESFPYQRGDSLQNLAIGLLISYGGTVQ